MKLNPSKDILVLPVGFGLGKITKKPDATALMNEGVEILNPVEVVAVGIERERRVLGYPDAGFNPVTSITIRDRSKPLPPQSFSEAPKKSTSLSFAGKNIEVIPTEIGAFKNLKFLDLENNLITRIPEELGQLEKLSEFYIPVNKLKELPASFGNLQNLKILGLARNELTGFPHALTKLEKLIALDLANNKIKNLPSEINQLKDLQELYLQNNEITALPAEFFELTKLKKLHLEGNPINEKDKAILKQRLDKTEIHF
jgi:Leucine-rich repeat (LRR) protein